MTKYTADVLFSLTGAPPAAAPVFPSHACLCCGSALFPGVEVDIKVVADDDGDDDEDVDMAPYSTYCCCSCGGRF